MIDKAESTRRLTVLRDFLKNSVKEKTFDLDTWECGTTKCAVGWACYIPEFKKLGLKSKPDCYEPYPMYDGLVSWDAAAKFFGLTREQADFIFEEGRYQRDNPTISDVCQHIETVIGE